MSGTPVGKTHKAYRIRLTFVRHYLGQFTETTYREFTFQVPGDNEARYLANALCRVLSAKSWCYVPERQSWPVEQSKTAGLGT